MALDRPRRKVRFLPRAAGIWRTGRYAALGVAVTGALACSPPVVNGGREASRPGGPGASDPGGIIGLPNTDPGAPAPGPSGAPPSANDNCGIKRISLEKRPADLLLVLDRSRSMLQGPGGNGGPDAGATGPSKWTEVVAAIDPVVMRTQAQVAWGLKLYPVGDSCGVPDGASVPVALANHAAVMTSIRNSDPGNGDAGSTPTRGAIEKATAFMQRSNTANARYLVLATDGQPNCAGGGGRGGDDAAGAVRAISAAAMASIPTFVIGIATAGSDAHDTLNQMAVAGGRARGGAVRYYSVGNQAELASALESITGQVASCTFPLDPAPPTPDNVAVEIDGTRVARNDGGNDGWSYGPGNRSVVLHGPTCERLQSGAAKNVQILYGCPGMIVN